MTERRSDELQKKVKEFREYSQCQDVNFSDGENIPSDEAIMIAVDKAYGDLMFRTMKLKDKGKKTLKDEIKGEIVDGIEEYIRKCFKEKKGLEWRDFDENHNNMCGKVLGILKTYYVNAYNSTELKYGKAQKLINMTFKYLYCFEGAEKYEECFKYCHMPLDSFILEWAYRNIKSKEESAKDKEENKIVKKKIPSWSNLEYNEECCKNEEFYTYKYFLDEIRKIFDGKEKIPFPCGAVNGMTPLQAEFFVWNDIQLNLAAEEFIKQMTKNVEGDSEIKGIEMKTDLQHKVVKEVSKICAEYLKSLDKG